MGAWIETQYTEEYVVLTNVAPYVGAWIETTPKRTVRPTSTVAPYVGAWIETQSQLHTGGC